MALDGAGPSQGACPSILQVSALESEFKVTYDDACACRVRDALRAERPLLRSFCICVCRTCLRRMVRTPEAAAMVKGWLGSHPASRERLETKACSGSHVRRRRACRSRFPSANGFTGLTNEGVTHRVLVVRPQTRYRLEAQLAAITGKLLASSRAIDRSRHSFLYELETIFGGVQKCFCL